MPSLRFAIVLIGLLAPMVDRAEAPATQTFDVVVYGGTAGAVTAAVEAKKMGMTVALVCPDTHLGGMTSSGLGWTDAKNHNAIGGLARDFYHRIWLHYKDPAVWVRKNRAAYSRLKAQPGPAIDDKDELMWTFEPHVAEAVFNDMLKEAGVVVNENEWLDRKKGVDVANHSIKQIRMLSGRAYVAKIFIDATYEGDLMAAAGVTYRVGRDSASEYNEPFNGIYFHPPDAKKSDDNGYKGVDPYVVAGNASSGFLPGIDGDFPSNEHPGDADSRLQCFNFRLCLTNVAENRIPIEKPKDYKQSDYELLLRCYEAGHVSGHTTQAMPNGKIDANNLGPAGLDAPGACYSIKGGWNYSDADYDQRKQIFQAHVAYTQGMLWTIANDPRVPEQDRLKWQAYGLSADEFTDTGHWPFQLYVREARRMIGATVMTQHHILMEAGYEVSDPIGMGSYSLDSHVVRRVVMNGELRAEGSFYQLVKFNYPLSLGIIEPKRDEVTNLLNPITVSATHAAFGSIRMEPTYMILGQSAAVVAALAVKGASSVQDVHYSEVRNQLLSEGQILEPSPGK